MSAARRVLVAEAEALTRAAESLDEGDFERVVELLAGIEGKLVLLGVGTSGIIARKLAATFTSTGTPAFFLHPSDALHGGLGIVEPSDGVVVLSNSGETEEILAALPYLLARQVTVVSIVGSSDSTLARSSTGVVPAPVDSEACPLNLAPTCSSTLALALGDALAVALMERKGITAEAFARNHPSGRLGRRLTLTVEAVMRPLAEVVTVAKSTPWLDLVMAIGRGGFGAAPVIEEGVLVGIVTDGDIRRAAARSDATTLMAADLMTADPVVVGPDDLAYDALRVMEDRPSQIAVLPVVREATLVGMLRLHDVARVGL